MKSITRKDGSLHLCAAPLMSSKDSYKKYSFRSIALITVIKHKGETDKPFDDSSVIQSQALKSCDETIG